MVRTQNVGEPILWRVAYSSPRSVMARTLGSSRTSTRPPGVLTKIRPPPHCRVQTAAEVTGRPWVNRAAVRPSAYEPA
jgi:hypothetical protein